jgi:GTP-binding protein EngB required for normal cell division
MLEPRSTSMNPQANADLEGSISLARETIERFQLSDLDPLLRIVELQIKTQELHLAVFGRFNAGKSSFLNHLLGRPLLPVGVVPVTSAVTEISYGPSESAFVFFQKGRSAMPIPLAELGSYISESENPENRKEVETVRVSLPSLVRFRGLTFVDTPGLESVFSRSTEASLTWSPKADLVLVAVAVDPPLTARDISFLERLQRFTPNVSILLTKMDTLDDPGQREVLSFVKDQLDTRFPDGLRVFPFSIKQGYEGLRKRIEDEYVANAIDSFREQHASALTRKLQTLLRAIADYLQLALNAADARGSEREYLRTQVLGSEDFLADQKLQFQLLAQHAIGRTRPLIEQRLRKTALSQLHQRLADRLASEFPGWNGSFAKTLSQFEFWLHAELESEISAISASEIGGFQAPLLEFQRQCRENLQAFREQLSERVMRTFGFPLCTTEAEIEIKAPRTPDVSIGKIFDHNWELLSALIPITFVRGALERRFEEKIESEVFKNLSRLTSQWEKIIRSAILASQKEAVRRFEELVLTVKKLLSVADDNAKVTLLSYKERIGIASKQILVSPRSGE